jgi:hypothetical protein
MRFWITFLTGFLLAFGGGERMAGEGWEGREGVGGMALFWA